jgi:chemotaxis protein MotA
MPNTIIGFIITTVAIVGGMVMSGGVGQFIDPPSVFIVIIGAIGVTFASGSFRQFMNAMAAMPKIFTPISWPYAETIKQFREMAAVLRREGPMGLQSIEIEDDLMEFGTQLILGGVAESGELSNQLDPRLAQVKADSSTNASVWVAFGGFAPAYGMAGTLIGLVAMLGSLDDPGSIGPKMAVALITTLYGTLVANMICLPIANKISVNTSEEIAYKDMVVAGMITLLDAPDPDGLVDMMMARVPLGIYEEVDAEARAEAG